MVTLGLMALVVVFGLLASVGVLALLVWFCTLVGWHTVEGCKRNAKQKEEMTHVSRG